MASHFCQESIDITFRGEVSRESYVITDPNSCSNPTFSNNQADILFLSGQLLCGLSVDSKLRDNQDPQQVQEIIRCLTNFSSIRAALERTKGQEPRANRVF